MKGLEAAAVSKTLWALATMGGFHAALVKALNKRLFELNSRLSPQQLSEALWALATMGFNAEAKLMSAEDQRLMKALGDRAKATAAHFTPQQVADALWALATVGHEDKSVGEALSNQAKVRAVDFKPQQAADAMWGISIAELPHNQRLVQAYMGQATVPAPDFGVAEEGLYPSKLPRLSRSKSSLPAVSVPPSRASSVVSLAQGTAAAVRSQAKAEQGEADALSRTSSVDSAQSTVPQLQMQQVLPSPVRLPKLKSVGETVFAR